MFDTGVLQPRFQSWKVLSDFDRHMRLGRRTVIGILAQVDLSAVLAPVQPRMKPESLCKRGERRTRGQFAVSQNLNEEGLFGFAATHGHAEVHVMQTKHGWSISTDIRPWPEID